MAKAHAAAPQVLSWRAGANYDCFVINGTIRCSGLHRFLRRSLYPNWKTPAFKSTKKGTDTARSGAKPTKASLAKAMARGVLVDAQLKAIAMGEKIKGRKHPLTTYILNAFETWGWTMVEAQVIVGNPSARLATAFDLLCRTEANERVMVQVKTGYDDTFKISGGQRLEHKSVSNVPSTPRTHAILQAAMEARLFEETRALPVHHVYVVRAYKEGCERVLVRSVNRELNKKQPKWLPDAMAVLDTSIRERQKQFLPSKPKA